MIDWLLRVGPLGRVGSVGIVGQRRVWVGALGLAGTGLPQALALLAVHALAIPGAQGGKPRALRAH